LKRSHKVWREHIVRVDERW